MSEHSKWKTEVRLTALGLLITLIFAASNLALDAWKIGNEEERAEIRLKIMAALNSQALDRDCIREHVKDAAKRENKCRCDSWSNEEIDREVYTLAKDGLVLFNAKNQTFELKSHSSVHLSLEEKATEHAKSITSIKHWILFHLHKKNDQTTETSKELANEYARLKSLEITEPFLEITPKFQEAILELLNDKQIEISGTGIRLIKQASKEEKPKKG